MGMTEINYPNPKRPYPLDRYIAEKQAELEDDRAGMSVGDLLYQKIIGKLSYTETKARLTNLLCE